MWLLWITLACQQEQASSLLPPDITAPDHDQDGFIALGPFGNDCDDDDAAVYPDASDLTCDGVDNDCDGRDGVDADDDGASVCADDCDDADPARSRLQPERCDRVDNDCDGLADDDFDQDGDGWLTCGAVFPLPEATVAVEGVITALYAVDLDHDGASEIIAFDEDHGDVSVVSGAPGAPLSVVTTLSTHWAISVHPVGDLNGDGLDEIAVATRSPGARSGYAVALYQGEMIEGRPFFSPEPFDWRPGTFGLGLAAVGLGDVDHDGRDDIALYGQRSDDRAGPADPGQLWIAYGAAQGVIERVALLGDRAIPNKPALNAADLDGDGIVEVVVVHPDPFTRTSSVHRVPIDPAAPITSLGRTIDLKAHITTGPALDGRATDQVLTLTPADPVPGGVAAGYLSDAQGYLSLASWFIEPTAWAEGHDRVEIVPDLDHDDRPDLLVAEHSGAAVLEVWGLDERSEARRSGRGAAPTNEPADFLRVSVAAADLDGDGRREAVIAEAAARTTLHVFALGADCDDADPQRNVDCP